MPPAAQRPVVVVTDQDFPDFSQETRICAEAGCELRLHSCANADDVIAAGADAAALLVNRAPIDARVLAALPACRIVVRYGIGVDNIDLAAARERRIAISNVPDYASGEVADHAVALALALVRQLPAIDQRVRGGQWRIFPDRPMPACAEMRFVTLGFGRIARQVAARARAFGFRLATHDPFITPEQAAAEGVAALSLEEAFATADVLSLHLPLSPATRHLVNRERLAAMKPGAVLVNTARGGLIDPAAVAAALQAGHLGGAGLDVFDPEPLDAASPLRTAPRTLLTSHVAWYSESSLPRLQRLAAEEAVRGIRGQALRSAVVPPYVPAPR